MQWANVWDSQSPPKGDPSTLFKNYIKIENPKKIKNSIKQDHLMQIKLRIVENYLNII